MSFDEYEVGRSSLIATIHIYSTLGLGWAPLEKSQMFRLRCAGSDRGFVDLNFPYESNLARTELFGI